jgi:hypothetical protein
MLTPEKSKAAAQHLNNVLINDKIPDMKHVLFWFMKPTINNHQLFQTPSGLFADLTREQFP